MTVRNGRWLSGAASIRGFATIAIAVSFGTAGCESDHNRGGAANDRAGSAQAALDQSLEAARAAIGVPGASAVVVYADGTRWTGAVGVADVDTGRRVSADTPFAVASVTKTFVAALVLQLVEEGALDLDEPVARWLPQLMNARSITLRQLLGHTSGLSDVAVGRDRHWTPAEVLAELPQPTCVPDACLFYSDTNYVVAAAVVEAATETSITDLVRTRFLEPLHMTGTWFQQTERDRARIATVYDGVRGLRDENGDVPSTEFVTRTGYAGSLAMTASDLATWGRALWSGEMLRQSSIEAMIDFDRTAELPCPVAGRCPAGYGLGTALDFENGWLTWGHSGSTGALVSYFPEQNITIAVLTNSAPATGSGAYPVVQALADAVPATNGETDIFAIDRDGTHRRRVTTTRGPELAPAVSPDGARLAFSSDLGVRGDDLELVVARIDGSNRQVLTHNDVFDGRPAWSPDGRRLAFSSDRAGQREIFVMDPAGTHTRQLTDDAAGGANTVPSFSPDGRLIAYAHLDFENFEIRVMRSDGTQVRTVVRQRGTGDHPGDPTWSPDGQRLAFTGYDGPDQDIQVVDLDGSELRTLTRDHVTEARAVWAADGTIAFLRDGDLWMVDPDHDEPPRRLTDTAVEEYFPNWSPDARTLYFVASRALAG